jgi:O-succinylbenzoate synthase
MSLLAGDVTAGPLAEDAGELPVRRPAVDAEALARWETDPGPWRRRATEAARYLSFPLAQTSRPTGNLA